MARVELPIVVLNSSTGLPVNGASVAISFRATGNPATWYTAETGGTASTAAVITDAYGRTNAWLPRGAYNCAVSGTGVTPYTEPFDASPAVDSAVDSLWLADGSVTNAKLASGIDAAKITTGILPATRLAAASVTRAQLGSDAKVAVASSGVNSGATYNGSGGTYTTLTIVTRGGPVLVGMSGYLQHNGVNGTRYIHTIGMTADGVDLRYLCTADGSINGNVSGATGSDIYAGLPSGSHTFRLYCVSGTTATWALYNWNFFAAELV